MRGRISVVIRVVSLRKVVYNVVMKYERIKGYKANQFRQVTGIKPSTFDAMVRVLRMTKEAERGRRRKLSIEDALLATLEYYKEYRTYECIAASYGVKKQNQVLA